MSCWSIKDRMTGELSASSAIGENSLVWSPLDVKVYRMIFFKTSSFCWAVSLLVELNLLKQNSSTMSTKNWAQFFLNEVFSDSDLYEVNYTYELSILKFWRITLRSTIICKGLIIKINTKLSSFVMTTLFSSSQSNWIQSWQYLVLWGHFRFRYIQVPSINTLEVGAFRFRWEHFWGSFQFDPMLESLSFHFSCLSKPMENR